jgi:NAD(P) transhydrogenase
MEQARVAMCRAFGIPLKESVDPLVPTGIFTLPEVGMVGLTEEGARAAGEDVETGRALFAANPRARIAGTTKGLVKLVFRAFDRRLLGAHILGEEATELIHIAHAMLHSGATVHDFIDALFNFPTRADAYKCAAYDALQHLEARAGSEERRRANGRVFALRPAAVTHANIETPAFAGVSGAGL